MQTGHATHTIAETALGELTLTARDGVLSGIYFPHHWYPPADHQLGERDDAAFGEAERQLAEYLAGERQVFELATTAHGDAFQRRVWKRLEQIPYGATTTYGAIARELGDVRLARKVGGAIGRNPLSIVVPCHRVIGKNGSLTGYAGGLLRKRRLLELEGAIEALRLPEPALF
jgi:methylated-DNA-[protein]-cysteine S-methyltransferase